jgi:L-seryl-tRNA(Ser) seleniumtransferase
MQRRWSSNSPQSDGSSVQKTTALQPTNKSLLRGLPGVDRLLRLEQAKDLIAQFGHTLVAESFREILEQTRLHLIEGRLEHVPDDESLLEAARASLADQLTPSLQPVINATGVIIHTNLGRAPLGSESRAAVNSVSAAYSNLEYELAEGSRGSRTVHAEKLITRLTGAEAALVVNNNAAAVLLMLTTLCRGKEVIISRGQLVEIGGGFRIPDVLAQSGAHLVEVGTTNRTHLSDYANAVSDNTAAILVTHYSNYKIVGFTSQPAMDDLANLAREHRFLLLFDQGSGVMLDVSPFGLEPEMTPIDGLRAGCDVVAFSGDKMLGGPQAGIIIGNQAHIERLKRHPFARAVRADKMCLAALSATLTPYLTNQAMEKIPVWRMISRAIEDITVEADSWVARLGNHGIHAFARPGESRIGGGSLPGSTLPTRLVAIDHPDMNADSLAVTLRTGPVPVIGRIQEGHLLLDPRTVLPEQVNDLIVAVIRACETPESSTF